MDDTRKMDGREVLKTKGSIPVLGKMDLSRIKVRLDNISKKATKSVSFQPSEITLKMPDYYPTSKLVCLEELNSTYPLHPEENQILTQWNTYAYDESVQDFKALEGDLLFCSSAVIKIEQKYAFNLVVLPHFITSMRRFKGRQDAGIFYTDNPGKTRNRIIIDAERSIIEQSVEPHSIVLIDGPLVGRNATSLLVNMDDKLRAIDCLPLYFVKNSDSRLIIDDFGELSNYFNSDFHWAAHKLADYSRTAFFRYTDENSVRHSKVLTYVKALAGFTERVEMHSETYERHKHIISQLMNAVSYLYVLQGDNANPQVRPIAIAEKYAREGLRLLNIPALLSKLGFRPTVNQVRFG